MMRQLQGRSATSIPVSSALFTLLSTRYKRRHKDKKGFLKIPSEPCKVELKFIAK